MSYSSPLARLPTKRRTKEVTKSIIPETIELPDGRTFVTKTLLNQIQRRTHHNLLTKKKSVTQVPQQAQIRPYKYTIEDRRWQNQATVEQIAERYQLTEKQAQSIKYHCASVLERLEQCQNPPDQNE